MDLASRLVMAFDGLEEGQTQPIPGGRAQEPRIVWFNLKRGNYGAEESVTPLVMYLYIYI